MSARDDYSLAWQTARSRAHEDIWSEVVSALEEIDQLRSDLDGLLSRRDEVMRAAGQTVERLVRERREADEVISLAIALHPDRCTPRDGRPMAAWCTWCDVLEPFRDPA